jgi:hypothetical protein
MLAVGIALWALLLAAILAWPAFSESASPGNSLTRNTVRLALLYYAAAAALMLLLRPDDWTAGTPRGALARSLWTLAALAFLVHVGMAFHYVHHWSHTEAVQHTAAVSGVGEGIYLSYLFTLLWIADVLFWWVCPGRYAGRSPWVDWTVHGFMVFMIFNGTVVFETGPIRWGGAAMCAPLAALWVYRQRGAPPPRPRPGPAPGSKPAGY